MRPVPDAPAAPPPAGAAGGLWRRSDPRARLLATLCVSGAVLAAGSWPALAAGLAGVAAVHASSATGPRAALASLRPFAFLLVFTLVLQSLFTPGTPLAPGVLPDRLTLEGVAAAALAAARLGGVIALSAHLVATTSPLELARGIGWAIAPAARVGVPVREITLVTALAFHFFPVLLEESRQVRAALESRGVSLRHRSPRLRVRALLVWVLAVLFGMVDRSARIAAALQTRGFGRAGAGRHRFAAWGAGSTALVAAGAAALAVAVALGAR
jgi:energy-coupling factor transport system permease protein